MSTIIDELNIKKKKKNIQNVHENEQQQITNRRQIEQQTGNFFF